MTGARATGNPKDQGTSKKKARVYVDRLADATQTWINWKRKKEVYWHKYQIKETDMRVKTASFVTDTYLDLTTGVYCVLITSPEHEDFGGIILDVEKDTKTGLYSYQCQDFTRQLQQKVEMVFENITLHRLLESLMTDFGVPLSGDAKSARKKWKKVLSGLRPDYQYEQKYWGSSINFNPMTQSMKGSIKGKSIIEVIRDYCLGSGAYIDVYPNKYGILQIEPYHKKDWLESNVTIPYHTIQDMKVKFDTKNIVTGVSITSSDSLKIGGSASSKELIGLDLAPIFGNNGASITTSEKTETKTNTSKGNNSSVKNTANPYGTKLKKIYINSDNIYGKSADKQFMKDFAAAMRKQGWKTKIIGLGPNTHTEKYMNGCRDGVWFCIYGGADAAVFRETVKKNSYTNKLKSLNSRTVIGMRTGGNIRKGGKYYKWLPRAHDDNYSPSSFKGISYPLDVLTKGKVPIMYANSVKDMVAKFLAGGDNKEAC